MKMVAPQLAKLNKGIFVQTIVWLQQGVHIVAMKDHLVLSY